MLPVRGVRYEHYESAALLGLMLLKSTTKPLLDAVNAVKDRVLGASSEQFQKMYTWTVAQADSWTPRWVKCYRNESNMLWTGVCISGYDQEKREEELSKALDPAKLAGAFAFMFFLVLVTRRSSGQEGSIFQFRRCPGGLGAKEGELLGDKISFQKAVAEHPLLGLALANAAIKPQGPEWGSVVRCAMDGNDFYVPRHEYNELAQKYNFLEEIS